jgi:hypothetical protein
MLAVDRFCKNLCNGSFTGTAGAAEQIGVPDTVSRNLVSERFDNRILPFYVCKRIRTEFSV